MMIFVAVVIAVVVLAFALPGPIYELQRRRRSGLPRHHPHGGPLKRRLVRTPDSYADWWPDFERQFRAYVREREREAH